MDSSHDSSHVRSRLCRSPSPLSAAVELDSRALGAIAEWKGGPLTTPVNEIKAGRRLLSRGAGCFASGGFRA